METGEDYTHGQFVDDTNMVVEVKVEYIEYTFNIFQQMGLASRLFVKESGVKAVLSPPRPCLSGSHFLTGVGKTVKIPPSYWGFLWDKKSCWRP